MKYSEFVRRQTVERVLSFVDHISPNVIHQSQNIAENHAQFVKGESIFL